MGKLRIRHGRKTSVYKYVLNGAILVRIKYGESLEKGQLYHVQTTEPKKFWFKVDDLDVQVDLTPATNLPQYYLANFRVGQDGKVIQKIFV